ncbi:MAG: pentapeptide repeat-containing protein [Acidobacteria bacterium]|nr:pentapeptide repeat-containing protein [Acidobacteriota bacterium]
MEQKKRAKGFDFTGVWFSVDVQFRGIIESVSFTGAKFGGQADFSSVTFEGRSDFCWAVFGGRVVFSYASFNGVTDFSWVQFGSEAVFHNVNFKNKSTFGEVTFRDLAEFSGAIFADEAVFGGLAGPRDEPVHSTEREVMLAFSQVDLLKQERTRFQFMDMAGVSFLETDVRRVEFTDVWWPEKLLDERQSQEHEYPLVEKLYRQLRQNYEDQGNYPDAGRFYYGEMEMRRKAKPWWQRYFFSLTALYWLSSGYGQKARRAGLWVILLLVLFAWLYSIAGLQPSGESSPVLDSPWAAILHVGEVLTFARERTYAAATDFGRWLSVAQTIVLPLQVALLVLAVRRSFMR